MRFDTKLTDPNDGWDDEVGEFNLPDGLAELGEQLQADSLHLARLYPPVDEAKQARSRLAKPAGDEVQTKSRRAKKYTLGSGLLAVVSLCLTVGIAIDWPAPETGTREADLSEYPDRAVEPANENPRPTPATLTATTPHDDDRYFTEPVEPVGSPSYVDPEPAVIVPVSVHDASVLNASGPQAEAYLDYIEMTTVRNVKLSF